jgi:hypothetical protein
MLHQFPYVEHVVNFRRVKLHFIQIALEDANPETDETFLEFILAKFIISFQSKFIIKC